MSDRANRAVDSMSAQDRPFFLYVADRVPHNEVPPANRHARRFDGATPPKTPSYNEANTSDKPDYIDGDGPLTGKGRRPTRCSTRDWPIAYPTTDRDCEKSYDYSRHYWESGLEGMESVNELYDRLIATLERTGELDNTYIFFVSDNGVHVGEHRQVYGKNTPYIEDIGVPFNVRGPGVPRGRALTRLVGLQDIAPTLTDLAGLGVPGEMDGRSLKPLLSRTPPANSAWRQNLLIEGYRGQSVDNPPTWRGLVTRDGRKYAEYATGERELYRLRRDPYELLNAARRAPAREVAALRARVKRLGACSGRSSCRAAEGP